MSSVPSSREISPDVEVENAFSRVKSNSKSNSTDESNQHDDHFSPKFFEFWNDGSRRSAFSPYTRPTTILTNLQRGNVKTEASSVLPDLSIHQLAAQGQLFSEMKVENVDEMDAHGLTPLMWACAYGQFPTVTTLLEKKADVNVIGNHGENSLLLASGNGHTDIVKLLIKKNMALNHTDERGNTALMYAAYDNHAPCAEELLKSGADFTISNLNGDTAYSVAVSRGNKHVQSIMERHMLNLLEVT